MTRSRTTAGKVKRVKAWMIVCNDMPGLRVGGAFYTKKDANQFAAKCDQVIPCTITYKEPRRKRGRK